MRGTRSNVVRPQVVARPVYEDFKPMFEWKQEESSDVLIVYLPGMCLPRIFSHKIKKRKCISQTTSLENLQIVYFSL